MNRWFALGFCLLNLLLLRDAQAFWPERRQDQFSTDSGYLFVPAPYEYPGVGSGTMLIGSMSNLFGSRADLIAIPFSGDAEGYVGQIDELFLVPDLLYFKAFSMQIGKVGSNVYSSRGMDSQKEDYSIFVSDAFFIRNQSLNLTLWDRRIELSASTYHMRGETFEIRDPEGNLIANLENKWVYEEKSRSGSLRINLTDDFNDPRSGVDGVFQRSFYAPSKEDDPEFYVNQANFSAFLPILKASTWVFNYMQADAQVTRPGNTDLESLKTEKGYYQCDGAPEVEACRRARLSDAQNTLNYNQNGSAVSLGGTTWLRGYPDLRFKSAHTRFLGTEMRFNYSLDKSIDWFLFKDNVHSLQLALFAETGSVAERADELWRRRRSVGGVGLRLLTASGNVYRLDVAQGDEGTQVSLFFNYPWDPAF